MINTMFMKIKIIVISGKNALFLQKKLLLPTAPEMQEKIIKAVYFC